jgi:Protein of unknown function (DUF1501)
MSSPSRREFLTAAAAGAAGLAIPGLAAANARPALGSAKSCIFINLVGGPGHIDTFDPKPDTPPEVRGPFRPIQTKVPGLHLSELFPKLAGLTDKFSLIRSMHHTAPPIHECGFQLLNTGRLFRDGPEWPSVGAVMSYLRGHRLGDYPAWAVLPDTRINTGISISHGQSPGFLSPEHFSPTEPRRRDTDPSWNPSLEALCRTAVGAIEAGAKFGTPNVFVTINQFSTVFDSPSWDCHADGGSLRTDLADIRDTVAPSFDTAFAALLTDFDARGLLDTTLVVATGEFGRTPLLNSNGGRDHWAGAWTALVAGGGVKGGRVIGRTDAKGTEPTDRPVTPQELVATIFHALGVPHDATIPGPDGSPVAVYPGQPVAELF